MELVDYFYGRVCAEIRISYYFLYKGACFDHSNRMVLQYSRYSTVVQHFLLVAWANPNNE